MRKKLSVVFLVTSLCGFWGCASLKSNEADGVRTELSAVDENREETPAPDAAIADEGQIPAANQNRQHIPAPGLGIATKLAHNPTLAPAVSTAPAASIVDPKREQASAGHSVTADKFAETPAATPRVKVNDPQVQPKSTAGNENTESKPAEMKVANAVDREPYLSSILKPLLPARTSVTNAATGFKNQKQFIAAMHLSRNLAIPFDQIKTRMTGEHRMSLQDSLRDLRAEMTKNDVKAEVNKAEKQAKEDENQAKEEAKKAAAQDKLAARD